MPTITQMCGRFTHLFKWQQLHRLMRLTTSPLEIPDRYNVAPTQRAPVVRDDGRGGRSLAMLRWGLLPSWANDASIGSTLINARAETIETKPSFRSAFAKRRCLVPISGFYEWQTIEAAAQGLFGADDTPRAKPAGHLKKQPHYITLADGEPMVLAGLWESWRDPVAGEMAAPVETFTIITTTCNEMMAKFHERMPVILDSADFEQWLDPAAGAERLKVLLRPLPAERMLSVAVSTRVNSPRNDDPSCIQPIAE